MPPFHVFGQIVISDAQVEIALYTLQCSQTCFYYLAYNLISWLKIPIWQLVLKGTFWIDTYASEDFSCEATSF